MKQIYDPTFHSGVRPPDPSWPRHREEGCQHLDLSREGPACFSDRSKRLSLCDFANSGAQKDDRIIMTGGQCNVRLLLVNTSKFSCAGIDCDATGSDLPIAGLK